jgi:hypothetical protein
MTAQYHYHRCHRYYCPSAGVVFSVGEQLTASNLLSTAEHVHISDEHPHTSRDYANDTPDFSSQAIVEPTRTEQQPSVAVTNFDSPFNSEKRAF